MHKSFEFPAPIPLKFSFRDALEECPDSKYFLSDEMYRFCTERDQYCKSHNLGYGFTPLERESCKIAKTITTREGSRIENNFIREKVHTDSDSVRKTEVEERESIARVYSPKGLCPTIVTSGGGLHEVKILDKSNVRKLTPKECFRLMRFSDSDYEKAHSVCSDTQLYKQAGNSIVVDVLEAVLKELLKDEIQGI